MLRYVLRRILWAIPTLFGVSLVVFTITTFLPDPLAAVSAPEESPEYEEAMEAHRHSESYSPTRHKTKLRLKYNVTKQKKDYQRQEKQAILVM